uniref:Protein kinase domain-containing protein n=1 Tax=Globisporangium ultimum (strain ATCC 200006 / CBS 805.95 / DAOM BR144) TaxID=431595 RepID=K3WIV5_GLOUD
MKAGDVMVVDHRTTTTTTTTSAPDTTDLGWKNISFKELTVCEQIGGGGVALVHCGFYRQQTVALKTLFDPRIDDELKQEFVDELLVMSKLRHRNIVSLIGACMEPLNLCIVMELCESSLHEALHGSNRYFSVQHLVRIAEDVASGMRDLKSHNVLLCSNGTAKLCDFGLVRAKCLTAGTPSYMPPELLSGKPFSKAVDAFMFGVLLWEIFTHEVPFQGYDVAEIRRKVLAGERFRVPTIDCPESCQILMRRCWDADPSRRPSFNEIHETLLHISVPVHHHIAASSSAFEGDALDGLLRGK